MTGTPSNQSRGLVFEAGQPLVGLFLDKNGRQVTPCFAGDAQADAALIESDTRAALAAIGALIDLDISTTAI
ncbi:MAG TPA: hypothetical protein VKZ96_05020 [Thermomicrobiales bacterium]|nr:hypothetical protein [Thermomicrobiales bacterium]